MPRSLLRLALVALCLGAPLTGCTGADGLLTAAGGGILGGSGLAIITNADPSATTVSPGSKVTLSVSVTSNPTGANVNYTWQASDGSLSATTGSTVVWTAPSSGTVTIQVTATNGTDDAPGAYRFTVQ